MNQRVPVKVALKDPQLSENQKNLLKLALTVRGFAENNLHLKPTENYTSFVQLDRPYITYLVMAAPPFQLEHHKWSFPFVGQVPYKGFYSLAEAQEEEQKLKLENYDTYVRGATAYSTLGWFDDPILSTMLNYEEHDFVETLIHETVHATLYIKSHADFNERLATYIGQVGTELFYQQKEGWDSPTLKKIKEELNDRKLFSQFISDELDHLKLWYHNHSPLTAEEKDTYMKSLLERYKKNIQPQLKTSLYSRFGQTPLNNAYLLSLKTYIYDLSDFDVIYKKVYKENFQSFLQFCLSLEKEKDPEKKVKEIAKNWL